MTRRHQAIHRHFHKHIAAISLAAFAIVLNPWIVRAIAQHNESDLALNVGRLTGVRQTNILFDPTAYSAFPHLVRLEGDELLIAFRQAPPQSRTRHTHPRSIITVIRSYDLGETWDVESSTQLAPEAARNSRLSTWGTDTLVACWLSSSPPSPPPSRTT